MALGQAPALFPSLGLLYKVYSLELSPGSLTVTGNTVSLLHHYRPQLVAGSYAITGKDVTLTEVAGNSVSAPAWLPSIGIVMELNTGVYVLALAAGSYTVSGVAVATHTGKSLPLATGSYAITGAPADVDHEINTDGGSYAVTGVALGMVRTYLPITLGTGSYAVTGQQIGLSYVSGTNFNLPLNSGSYTVSGQPLTFAITRYLALGAGSYSISGIALNTAAPVWTIVTPSASVWTPVTPTDSEWEEAA